MNKLISIALAGALSTLICGAALADDMGMGKDSKTSMEQKMAKKQADKLTMMTKTLSLTPDQVYRSIRHPQGYRRPKKGHDDEDGSR